MLLQLVCRCPQKISGVGVLNGISLPTKQTKRIQLPMMLMPMKIAGADADADVDAAVANPCW